MISPIAFEYEGFKTKYYLTFSFVTHLVIFIFLIFSKNVKNFFVGDSTSHQIEQIVRVDVVGLPKLTQQELEELKNNLEVTQDNEKYISDSKSEIDSTDKEIKEDQNKEIINQNENKEIINQDENSDTVSDRGLDLIKSLSQQKGATFKPKKGKTTSAKKQNKKSSKRFQNLIIERNKLSKGSSINGRYQSDVAEFDKYVLNLPNLIRPFWKLPSFLKESNFNARVIIYINDEGNVIHYRFVSKSGNEEFDDRVIKSIEKSQPFPVPSDQIKDTLLSEGVILGFPL